MSKTVRKPGDFVGPIFISSTMGKWEKEFPGFQKLLVSIREAGIDGAILKPLVQVFGSHMLEWKPTNTRKGPFSDLLGVLTNGCSEKVTWSLFTIDARTKGSLWRRHKVFTARRISLRAREVRVNAESQWKPQEVHDGDSIATALSRMDSRQLSQVTVLATVAHRQYLLSDGSPTRKLEKVDLSLFKAPSDLTTFRILLNLAVRYPEQPLI